MKSILPFRKICAIESCHLWECHLWRFYCTNHTLLIMLFRLRIKTNFLCPPCIFKVFENAHFPEALKNDYAILLMSPKVQPRTCDNISVIYLDAQSIVTNGYHGPRSPCSILIKWVPTSYSNWDRRKPNRAEKYSGVHSRPSNDLRSVDGRTRMTSDPSEGLGLSVHA